MITREQYEVAVQQENAAHEIIQAYGKQKHEEFEARWERFKRGEGFFTDDDLCYAAGARCHCGAGLAYPRECGGFHQWDCSAVLKGTHDKSKNPHEVYPFAFYSIKSEGQPSAQGHTTRPAPVEKAAGQGAEPLAAGGKP